MFPLLGVHCICGDTGLSPLFSLSVFSNHGPTYHCCIHIADSCPRSGSQRVETLVLLPPRQGHCVPHVRNGNSGPLFIGLWLFSIFPLSTSSALYLFLVVFLHILQLCPVWPLKPLPPFTNPFLSDLASYTFFHTQFFTPLSTSAPLLSVTLISSILIAFSSSFFPVLRLEFAIYCMLS